MFDSAEFIVEIRKYSEGMIAYMNQDGHWGFLNEYGQIVIPAIYSDVSDFNGGMAYVRQNAKNGSYKTMYIDKLGNQISKNGYSASPSIVEGYGVVTKYSLLFEGLRKYILNKYGKMYPIPKTENFESYYHDVSRKLDIHNNILFDDINDDFFYKLTNSGMKSIHAQGHTYHFELNPVDNKIYAIIYYFDDGVDHEHAIIDENGKDILYSTEYEYTRIDNKYFMSKRNDYWGLETSIFFIDMNAYDEAKIINYVFNKKENVTKAKVINDSVILYNINDKNNSSKERMILYSIKSNVESKEFDNIFYEDGYDYFICKDDNSPIYQYFNYDLHLVFESTEFIISKNSIGISKQKEIIEDSNISHEYIKYTIYDYKSGRIVTYPNDEQDIKITNLKHIDDVLVGNSLYGKYLYIIYPKNNFSVTKVEFNKYEYVDGYFIISDKNGHSLIDKDGNYVYKNIKNIVNVGNHKILAVKENWYDLVDLVKMKWIVDSKLLESDETNIFVPVLTDSNTVSPIPLDYKILLNKKEIINKLIISQDVLFEYVEEEQTVMHDEMYKDFILWQETHKYKVKYFRIKDEYKRLLKYYDLSKFNFDNVDISGCDFTDTNAKIDPQTVHNKDLRGTIIYDYNMKEQYMKDKSYWKELLIDEKTVFLSDLNYYVNMYEYMDRSSNNDAFVLQKR